MGPRPEGSIAVNLDVARFVDTRREVVDVESTDFTDVSAVVLSAEVLRTPAKALAKKIPEEPSSFDGAPRAASGESTYPVAPTPEPLLSR